MFPKKKWGWTTPEKAPGDAKKRLAVLDRIFSEYIRRRDADGNGVCRCITCGHYYFWKEMDAGHFINRDKKAVRFDERNVNAQCPACNRFHAGEQHKHAKAIDRKHGTGTADLLENLGSARGAKLDIYWIEDRITHYRKKVKELSCKMSAI